MSRYPQPSSDARGSLRWIQEYVRKRSEELDRAINQASKGRIETPIDWKSPRPVPKFRRLSRSHSRKGCTSPRATALVTWLSHCSNIWNGAGFRILVSNPKVRAPRS